MIADAIDLRGMAALSREGRIVQWDAVVEDLFGWVSEEVLGRDFAETLVAPGHREDFRRDAREAAAAQGCPVIGRRWRVPLLTATGEVVEAAWAVVPRSPWASRVELRLGRVSPGGKP